MVYALRFFFPSKCSLFHNSNFFGSCVIHILYTGCAKIKKNNSGAKRLITAQLDRVCDGKSRRFVQLKFPDCVTLGTADDLTAQFTSDCSVCCVLKAEAQFVHSFNAVNIT